MKINLKYDMNLEDATTYGGYKGIAFSWVYTSSYSCIKMVKDVKGIFNTL